MISIAQVEGSGMLEGKAELKEIGEVDASIVASMVKPKNVSEQNVGLAAQLMPTGPTSSICTYWPGATWPKIAT
jgi:hypothetical protein